MDVNQTLKDLRKLKHSKLARKKSPKEKWVDYYHRVKGGRCDYCKQRKEVAQFRLMKKVDDSNSKRIAENRQNIVMCCNKCRRIKGKMNHFEFKDYIREMKKKTRDEISKKSWQYRRKVIKKYKGECIFCLFEFGHTPKGKKLTIEHKTPVGRLGGNGWRNLGCSCKEHNYEKGVLSTEEYFEFLKKEGRQKRKQALN